MSTSALRTAKSLIDAKRYDEARGILHTINHPTAHKWLNQLDRIAPSVSAVDFRSELAPNTDFVDLATARLNQPLPARVHSSRLPAHFISSESYIVVRLCSYLYFVLGGLALISGVAIGGFFISQSSAPLYGPYFMIQAIVIIVAAVLLGLSFCLVGQLLQIFLEIGVNSRKQIQVLGVIAAQLDTNY